MEGADKSTDKFENWAIPGLFILYIRLWSLLTSFTNIADDWIRTADLLCWKILLYELSNHHRLKCMFFGKTNLKLKAFYAWKIVSESDVKLRDKGWQFFVEEDTNNKKVKNYLERMEETR